MNTEKHSFKYVSKWPRLALFLLGLLLMSGCKPKVAMESKEIWLPGDLSFAISTPGGTIQVGDPYEVTFSAIYPTNGTVSFPEIGRGKEIVVLNREWREVPFEPDRGHKKEEVTYTLTSFRIGDHLICKNPMIYQHDGISESRPAPETTLTVVSSLPENAASEIADIKPEQKLPGRIPRWLWIAVGASAIAFLVGLITSKLWHHRENIIAQAPVIPPHVIALKALDALKQKQLLEQDKCNAFYTELSLILRTYLEGRFRLNAPDETTEEIVEELSRSPELGGAQRNMLQEFMRQADMVKFAKGRPDRSTMESAFSTTRQFVEQTQPPTDQND
jgi:hypothetical protein